jgi:uncharacterized protein YqeY
MEHFIITRRRIDMGLSQTLRIKLTEARKSGNTLEMGLLQVIIGDADMQKARVGKELSDEEVEKIIRKMANGIEETMTILKDRGHDDGEDYIRLRQEQVYTSSLLPKTLSVEEIKTHLAALSSIKEAQNNGQAMGLAMKHLKSQGLKVLGQDVTKAIEEIRS